MPAELLADLSRATDGNDNPLSGAVWYFYLTGTTTPQAVYADAALNTSLGSSVTADSGGKFAAIYFDTAIVYRGILKTAGGSTIKDVDPINSEVFADLSADIAAISTDLASTASGKGGALVGFKQLGTGASARTMLAKAREVVSVKDFGAVGDGVTDDTNAINTAISWVLSNPESALLFEETTYLVGSSTPNGGSIFTIVGGTGFTMRGRPTFRVTGTNAKGVNLFRVQMGNVDIEYIKAVGDAWTVPSEDVAVGVGIATIYVQNPTLGTTISGFNFGEVVTENCTWAVLFDANTKTYGLSSDAYIGSIKATNTVYGLNCAQSPNNLVCNQIVCDNVFRGYFPYGVDNHVVSVEFKSTYTGIFAGGTCVNITVYTESSPGSYANRVQDTRNINVKIYNTSNRPTFQLSTVSQATTDNSTGMYNIFVDAVSTAGTPVKIFNGIGVTPNTSTAFASPKRNIYIRATGPSAALSSTDYGVFNTANCYGLTLDAGNFLDSALAARQSMLTSGWNIIDGTFGRQFFQQYWVAKSGSSNIFAVAVNEDPHLSIGSDSSNITRWRAGSSHVWYVGGALNAQMTSTYFRPWVDNTLSLGGPSNRWSEVYAAAPAINTSDREQKQDISDLDAAEKRVAVAIKALIKKFRFKDAVALKGENARIHVGVIAQDVGSAFEAEGLDPERYGLFCKDRLEDGTYTYGVRYEELLAFVIAAL